MWTSGNAIFGDGWKMINLTSYKPTLHRNHNDHHHHHDNEHQVQLEMQILHARGRSGSYSILQPPFCRHHNHHDYHHHHHHHHYVITTSLWSAAVSCSFFSDEIIRIASIFVSEGVKKVRTNSLHPKKYVYVEKICLILIPLKLNWNVNLCASKY